MPLATLALKLLKEHQSFSVVVFHKIFKLFNEAPPPTSPSYIIYVSMLHPEDQGQGWQFSPGSGSDWPQMGHIWDFLKDQFGSLSQVQANCTEI